MRRQNKEQLFLLIDSIVDMHEHMVVHLHNFSYEPRFESGVMRAAYLNHLMNFKLWHEEDKARRKDVPANVIAECKQKIDFLNQKRTDASEKLDQLLVKKIPGNFYQFKMYNDPSLNPEIYKNV